MAVGIIPASEGATMHPFGRRMRYGMAVIGLILSASPVFANGKRPAFPGEVQPIYREVGDWLLACDNVRRCVAKYAPDPEGAAVAPRDTDAWVAIIRNAGPQAMPVVDLAGELEPDPATVRIDGTTRASLPTWRSAEGNLRATGPGAMAFVRSMRDGRALSWSGKGGVARVSLRGLAAVLIAMDEAQGRLNRIDALARPGSRPAGASSSRTPLPVVIPAKPASALLRPKQMTRTVRRQSGALLQAHACDMEADVVDSADALDARTAIVLLACGRFAYQTSVLAFLVPRDRPDLAKPLVLDDPLPEGTPDPDSAGEYVEGSYDAETRVFATFAKGRGMADCGSRAEWTFDGQRFRLSFYAAQHRCYGPPGDWPVLFRTADHPGK